MSARFAIAAAVAVVLAGAGGIATADPKLDLEVKRGAIPRTLKMRTAQADEPVPPDPVDPDPAPGPLPASGDAAVEVSSGAPAPRAADFDVAGVRRADEQVVFRLDLGFAADGGSISGRRAIAGEPLSQNDYREVRAQGFGNLFVGTRGLFIAPLSSYLSIGFRLTPGISQIAPLADALDSTRDVQVRAGWAEASNFLPGKLLRSVRVRGGRQYAYGPWPIHFDGAVFAWTSKVLQLNALAGVRVDDFAPQGEPMSLPPVAAIIAAVDLGALGRWPITVRGTAMWLDTRRFTDLELGYRPRRGVVVVGGIRRIDDDAGRERVSVRAQISEVTHVVFDFEHRNATDWRWDMAYVDPAEPGAARPYLELPATIPQIRASLRGGTVLLDNIDLTMRGAIALDLVDRPEERTGFAEIGGAIEVRPLRALAFTASAMVRDYELTDSTANGVLQTDVGNQPGPLIDPADPNQASSLGQESFIEGGGGFRYSTGARRFSASAEIYARRSKFALLYLEDTPDLGDIIDRFDLHAGGRFALDGWLSPRLRLHLEYDLSSTLERAPEINGWKQLRLLAEGSF